MSKKSSRYTHVRKPAVRMTFITGSIKRCHSRGADASPNGIASLGEARHGGAMDRSLATLSPLGT